MPTLKELEATFLKVLPLDSHGRQSWETNVAMAAADGLIFLCPKCFAEHGGPVGTHVVICWFTGRVPDDLDPRPGRWNPQGTGLDDLTFVGPGAVSVLLTSGCGWHGLVQNGAAA
jgi:hypothetical protein